MDVTALDKGLRSLRMTFDENNVARQRKQTHQERRLMDSILLDKSDKNFMNDDF